MDEHAAVPAPQPSTDFNVLAYQVSLKGYGYRDRLIPQEFAHMVQTFVIFVALLGATKAFVHIDRIFFTISVGIALIGAYALWGFVVDIAANTSCKRALRKVTADLEGKLYPPTWKASYWKVIGAREKFAEERIAESAATSFVWAARFLFLLWIILSALLIITGDVLNPRP